MSEGARPPESIRLDKWLWHARFCKTRSLATELVSKGRVRVNSKRVSKPATMVKPGDGLSFALHDRLHVVRITAIAERRGPATEARLLYEEVAEQG